MISQAVKIYNEKRLHWSLDFRTPQEAHSQFNTQICKSYKRTNVVVGWKNCGNKMWENWKGKSDGKFFHILFRQLKNIPIFKQSNFEQILTKKSQHISGHDTNSQQWMNFVFYPILPLNNKMK